jgi:hypothetical protein
MYVCVYFVASFWGMRAYVFTLTAWWRTQKVPVTEPHCCFLFYFMTDFILYNLRLVYSAPVTFVPMPLLFSVHRKL